MTPNKNVSSVKAEDVKDTNKELYLEERKAFLTSKKVIVGWTRKDETIVKKSDELWFDLKNLHDLEDEEEDEPSNECQQKWRIPVIVVQQRWSFEKWKKLIISAKVYDKYSICLKKISIKEFNKKENKDKVMKNK